MKRTSLALAGLLLLLVPGGVHAQSADVAAAERAVLARCLSNTDNGGAGCACVIAGLRRAIAPGDYHAALDVLGLQLGATTSYTVPATVQNRHGLTAPRTAALTTQLSAAMKSVTTGCASR